MSLEEPTTTIRPPGFDASRNGNPAVAGDAEAPQALTAQPTAVETRGARFSRKARRARFNAYAFFTVALLVCLVALVVANTRQVKLSWVVGSSTASLVWIILCSAILGGLLGIVSSALIRRRTRAPRA